jgi:hypothetical protein
MDFHLNFTAGLKNPPLILESIVHFSPNGMATTSLLDTDKCDVSIEFSCPASSELQSNGDRPSNEFMGIKQRTFDVTLNT